MVLRVTPLLEPAAREKRAVRLLFVCTGNICRSPLAHAVFDHQAERLAVARFFLTESAGTVGYHVGENADSRMRSCARRHGVTVDHAARLFRPDDLDYFDLILAMDRGHQGWLQSRAHTDSQRNKIMLYREFEPRAGAGHDLAEACPQDVPDPYYGEKSDFEAVFALVEPCSAKLLATLLAAMGKYAPPV